MTDEERFWAKVDRSGECWTWTAGSDDFGYGSFRVGGRSGYSTRAHRFSWVLAHGPIPGALCVLHRCDNPPCVNPAHLFLGTRTDNMADKVAKGRARGNPHHGESHNMAKLTEAEVLEIRRCGGEQRDVAAMFGVSQTLISAIRRRKIWTHI